MCKARQTSSDKIAIYSLRYDYGFLWQVLNVLGVFYLLIS